VQPPIRTTYKIPIFFHNFRGYDSHLLVHAFSEHPGRKISVMGQSIEKYLSVSWGDHIVFKDSLQFLNALVEKLVDNLSENGT